MIKLAHLSDVHIPNNVERHEEYELVFQKIYKELSKEKPDRIVVVGDLFHNFIKIENEAKVLAGNFLNKLTEIAPVIITRGNHDIRKKHLLRKDSIEAIVTLIDNPKVTYYYDTNLYEDNINGQEVVWAVWNHPDKVGPWQGVKKSSNKIYIDLFHDPIQDCELYNGVSYSSRTVPKISQFKGDYSFFGDIHLRQFFDYKYVEKEIDEHDLDDYLRDGWEII